MKPSWMKFHFDFFDDARVKVIESMPDSDTLIVIWFQLLAFVGNENTSGKLVLRGRDETPCTDELLASIIRRPLPTMRLALATFVQMGMLQSIDGILVVTDWNRYVDEERLHRFDHREKPGSAGKAQVVLAYAAAHPDASQVKIAKETGVPRSSVQRYLKSLPALPRHPAQTPCPNGVPTLPSGLPTGTEMGTPVGTPEPLENTGIREGAQTKEIDKDIEIDKDTSSSTAGDDAQNTMGTQAQATPPSLQEVEAFFAQEGIEVDPRRFHAYFSRRGWVTKSNRPVDDWKRMARTWAKHEHPDPVHRPSAHPPLREPTVEEIMERNKVGRDIALDMLKMGLY